MTRTPAYVVELVVQSVCGTTVERLVPLTGGGMSETYRVLLTSGSSVVARVARQPQPWFTSEAHLAALAHDRGVPVPEVLGVEHVEHEGELLSVALHRYVAGRSLDQVVGQVPRTEAEQLVVAAGEVLARVHGAVADRGVRHELRPPDDVELDGVVRVVGDALGAGAAAVVARGAAFLHEEVERRPAPSLRLAHGDFLPKNLVVEADAIVAVIDWELAGPAPAAFDLARWEVSAGPPWHDWSDLLLEGYARTAGPEAAAADGLVPAYAVDWALEKLGWRNPAPLAQRRRCVDVIARYVGPGASV